MLRVSAAGMSFGAEVVLKAVSFVLGPGERAGLVGPNGAGKSTLLRIIAGEIRPDEGSVWLDPADRVALLPQYPAAELDLSVRESLWRGAGLTDGRDRLRRLEAEMAEAAPGRLSVALEEYAAAQERFEAAGGYTFEARMEEMLAGLGIDTNDLDRPVRSLSGGNKTKLSLVRLLLADASILLLDEPTNYLDLPALLWLERFVRASDRTHVIVSHDRRFLDRTVDQILELDPETHGLRVWPGGYSAFAGAKLRERQALLAAYADQQAEIRRVEQDIRRTKEQARRVEARTKSGPGADVQRRLARKVAKKAKVRERRLERTLASPERIKKPTRSWNLHLGDLGRDAGDDPRTVLAITDLQAGYEGHTVLSGVDLLLRGHDRVALMGENGSGKTTLLRCIAGEIPYAGTIRIGPSIRLGLLSQEGQELPAASMVLDVVRARTAMREDEARTYLHRLLFAGDDVLKPVGALSYGQRQKLALALLILSDANFLVLDEPTSHLDLPAIEAMERALEAYTGPLLLISHDRSFLERVGVNRIDVLGGGRLRAEESIEAYEARLMQ